MCFENYFVNFLLNITFRASDRRKKLAFQKAETQRRLFKSNTNHQQQHESNISNKTEKNKLKITRKKKELVSELLLIFFIANRFMQRLLLILTAIFLTLYEVLTLND